MKDFIEIDTNVSDKKLTFLLDTQADISLVKENSLFTKIFIDTNDTITLKGITSEGVLSRGKAKINLNIDDVVIPHDFNVVSFDFPIPADGIL